MSMSMDELEAAVNEVSDRDWAWWPFLWLRPEKHQHLSLLRVASISLLYGVPASVLTELAIKLQYAATIPELVATSLFFPLLFLFSGSVFVAPMWNRRADSLRARRASGFNA
jgi:hypothetical protein